MTLLGAFEINKGEVIALAGGGGKTTTMFAMGYEAANSGYKVVLTTTTRIYAPAPDPRINVILKPDPDQLLLAIKNSFKTGSVVVAGAGLTPDNKIIGIDKELAGLILQTGAELVVVEADGAAGKPFKAPRDDEPVIPGMSTLVIPMVGIDCLYRPLIKENVHRPEIVSRLLGVNVGDLVTPAMVAGVLLHPRGYRKGIPLNSRWVPFINKVRLQEELIHAREIAVMLGRGGAGRVIIGAARESIPVREVSVFDSCCGTGRRDFIPPGNT